MNAEFFELCNNCAQAEQNCKSNEMQHETNLDHDCLVNLKKKQANVSLQSNLTAALQHAIFQISEIEVLSPSAAGFDKHNCEVLLGLNCARCRFLKK